MVWVVDKGRRAAYLTGSVEPCLPMDVGIAFRLPPNLDLTQCSMTGDPTHLPLRQNEQQSRVMAIVDWKGGDSIERSVS